MLINSCSPWYQPGPMTMDHHSRRALKVVNAQRRKPRLRVGKEPEPVHIVRLLQGKNKAVKFPDSHSSH